MLHFLRNRLSVYIALAATCAAFAPMAISSAPARAASSSITQPPSTASPTGIINNQKRTCVYDANSISGLQTFAATVGRQTIDCAMVYNTQSSTWADWTNPWFLNVYNANVDWAGWVRTSPANDRRQLIISQPLIPTSLAGTDWLWAGAAGWYTGYAKQFAQNLVADGAGDAVIRLSWEMNGTWNIDNIGNSPSSYAEWVSFWRQTVFAMRSVPGAHFVFDWSPNNAYRNIPLANYYPGNDVVDIIGDDTYDTTAPGDPTARWSGIYNGPSSLSAISAFAQANNKPLSIPEWGLAINDPTYIQNIANFVETNDVAFQTYYYTSTYVSQLQTAQNLAAYSAAFGANGYADGPNNGTDITPSPATSATAASPAAAVIGSPGLTTTAGGPTSSTDAATSSASQVASTPAADAPAGSSSAAKPSTPAGTTPASRSIRLAGKSAKAASVTKSGHSSRRT